MLEKEQNQIGDNHSSEAENADSTISGEYSAPETESEVPLISLDTIDKVLNARGITRDAEKRFLIRRAEVKKTSNGYCS